MRDRRGGSTVESVARMRRHDLPDYGAFHITMRGVSGCDIYRDDSDRLRFLRYLNLGSVVAEWRLLAFCLMRNHFHLIVLGELERISRGMHAVAFRHAQAFNRRHTRRGHLFQDRFHAQVIRDDEHLGSACAYVYANAERIGIADWPWRGGELLP
jgi:REP element-mobilizing transposase RayT